MFENGEISSMGTQVCNWGYAMITYIGDNQFFIDNMYFSLAFCDLPENTAFEALYYSDFFAYGGQQTYTYDIVYLDGLLTLTIFSANGDQAIYNNPSMSTQDFKYNPFTISPNPVSNLLNIQFQNVGNAAVEIYNNLGQTCIRQPLIDNHVDVAHLPAGIYFIKIQSDNKTSSQKFIKL